MKPKRWSHLVAVALVVSAWAIVPDSERRAFAFGVAASSAGDEVRDIVSLNNDVYIGGKLSRVGGHFVSSGVAKWNGSEWLPVGAGRSYETVYALETLNGDLYAGGNFPVMGISHPDDTYDAAAGMRGIAKWNGTSWSRVGGGVNGTVYDILAVGSDLYVTGDFTTAYNATSSGSPVTVNGIAKWNGTSWSALGTGFVTGGVGRALATAGGSVTVAGNFLLGGASNVAKWDGTSWSALGASVVYPAMSVAVTSDGSVTYVGTDRPSGDGTIEKFASGTWTSITTSNSSTDSVIHGLHVSGSNVYATGTFTSVNSVSALVGVAVFNGTNWSAMGTGLAGGSGLVVRSLGSEIAAGGTFTSAGGASAGRLAVWNGSTWAANSSAATTTSTTLATGAAPSNWTAQTPAQDGDSMLMPYCTSATQTDCIEEVGAYLASAPSTLVKGKWTQRSASAPTMNPDGYVRTEFQIPGLVTSDTRAAFAGLVEVQSILRRPGSQQPTGIQFSMYASSMMIGTGGSALPGLRPEWESGLSSASICVVISGKCVRYGDLDDTARYRVVMRTSWLLPTIVSGGIVNGTVQSARWTQNGSYRLVVEGGILETFGVANETGGIGATSYPAWNQKHMEFMVLDTRYLPQLPNCAEKGTMLVKENGYGPVFPRYNQATKSLYLMPSAPHFTSAAKTAFIPGAYQAQIPEAMVQCVWGVSGAETDKFTVTISEDSVEQTGFTQVITFANDVLNVSVSGFHYSQPSIDLKTVTASGAITNRTSTTVGQSTATTSASASYTPVKIGTPAVAKGKSLSLVSALVTAGKTAPKGTTATAKVGSSSTTICKMSGSNVVGLKAGTCVVSASVKPGPVTKKTSTSVTKGKSVSVSTIARSAGLPSTSGAKVLVVVNSTSRRICTVSANTTVKGLGTGTCSLTITVTAKPYTTSLSIKVS
ncbi:MAG: hypothetical protein RLZ84_395 [Actinomycetota bacterium]